MLMHKFSMGEYTAVNQNFKIKKLALILSEQTNLKVELVKHRSLDTSLLYIVYTIHRKLSLCLIFYLFIDQWDFSILCTELDIYFSS